MQCFHGFVEVYRVTQTSIYKALVMLNETKNIDTETDTETETSLVWRRRHPCKWHCVLVCFSGGGGSAELVQFAAPDDYRPVCEYDSIDFMLDVTVTQRYDGLFHTLIDYCDRILADTDLLLR